MSTRRRSLIIGGVVLLAVLAEVGLEALRPPIACVVVINDGDTPIEGLRATATAGGDQAFAPRIEPGEEARLYLGGRKKGSLNLDFRQRGNPLSGMVVDAFHPAALARENFVLVLRIKPNECQRYQADGEPTAWDRLTTKLKGWLDAAVAPN